MSVAAPFQISMRDVLEGLDRLVGQHRAEVQTAIERCDFYRMTGNHAAAAVEQVESERALRAGVVVETMYDRFIRRWEANGYDPSDAWSPDTEVEV